MKGVIVGGWRSTGTIKESGIPYDNYVILFMKPNKPSKSETNVKSENFGQLTTEGKFAVEDFNDVFNGAISDFSELADYVGTEVKYTFTDKGKLDMVFL